MAEKLKALDVSCPVCGSPATFPCYTPGGKNTTHWRRLMKAQQKSMFKVVK